MLNTLGPLTSDANWDSYVSVATMSFSFSIHQNKEHTCRHGVNLILSFSEQKLANFRKYESFKTASFIVLKLKKKEKKGPGPSGHFGISLPTRSLFLTLNIYFKRTFCIHSFFFFSLSVVLHLLLFLPSLVRYASVLSSPSVFSGFCHSFRVALQTDHSLLGLLSTPLLFLSLSALLTTLRFQMTAGHLSCC